MPICGHYFWDNQEGAKLFCKKLGHNSGNFSGKGSGEIYSIDSFRIGKCNSGDKWESCSGGCNDYQVGGACSNNPPVKCERDQAVKITIECKGGKSTQISSCTGTQLSKIEMGMLVTLII